VSVDVFRTDDDVHHHLDALDQPRVSLSLARYEELLAIEAVDAGGTHPLLVRLRRIEAAATAHVTEGEQLVAADACYATKHPTLAARHAALGALLIARGGVMESIASLAKAVGR